jgi:hypothetical protein
MIKILSFCCILYCIHCFGVEVQPDFFVPKKKYLLCWEVSSSERKYNNKVRVYQKIYSYIVQEDSFFFTDTILKMDKIEHLNIINALKIYEQYPITITPSQTFFWKGYCLQDTSQVSQTLDSLNCLINRTISDYTSFVDKRWTSFSIISSNKYYLFDIIEIEGNMKLCKNIKGLTFLPDTLIWVPQKIINFKKISSNDSLKFRNKFSYLLK